MTDGGRPGEHLFSNLDADDVTRRGIILSALAVGFAMAVRPVWGETITTDSAGMTAGEVLIPTENGSIPAYRAMPAQRRSCPVVLVVQEIFGVHEHIKDVCRRLAKLGYLAVAPELYARQGDVSKLSDIDEIRKIVGKVPDAQVMADLDATVKWVETSPEGDVDKLAITGFCWGGRIVWLYAAHSRRLKAGVAWYGRLVGAAGELQPKHPIDVAGSLNAPVLGLYGGSDQGIPLDTVERMQGALKAANDPSSIVVYPNTPHAFHADYRPSYRKEQAEDGWKRLQAWFKQYGVA
ncbi:carboxymethylenebutenolidase [Nitrospira sp. KM1]|uniref:dienelactone hydrolase family protein n=1 Tax=Nitrospira sp. KM1 TaxID=1936990 RepID=UPI0013A75EEF|nr:dienelactone hydrolase family protein [Nitrospira sp. KM1]BCA55032.1 carboxymethylenebutenolidase [Nitrospira sp. KM1]